MENPACYARGYICLRTITAYRPSPRYLSPCLMSKIDQLYRSLFVILMGLGSVLAV